MAEEEQDGQLSATFPDPPPFYKNFTSKNLARLREAKENIASEEPTQETSSDGQADPFARLRLLDLPPEVRTLIPPEPPKDGKYRSFGDTYDIHENLAPLSSLGVEQLYPSEPTPGSSSDAATTTALTSSRANTLKLLARSILLNYLELIGLLSLDPAQYEAKIEHLSTIFINAHHLINEYRPHQARETLILTMEEQVERKRAEIEGVKRMRQKVESVLKDLGKADVESKEQDGADLSKEAAKVALDEKIETQEKEKKAEEQRDVWKAMDEAVQK